MMPLITLIGTLLLALVATGSALWAYQARQTQQDASALLSCWALACVFIALGAVAWTLPVTPDSNLAVVQRMAENLGIYIGLPFVAAALVGLGRRHFWSAAGWGRLMLGLFAAFELSRQLDYGAEYRLLLGAACVLACLYGATGLTRLGARKAAWFGSACLALGLLHAAPQLLFIRPEVDIFLLCSVLALLMLHLAIRSELCLLQQRSTQP